MASTKESAPTDPATPEQTPEQRLVSRERANEITTAVESLPDRQRTVFTLCHLAEQTTAEVSAALGVSEATVRVHLFRAIRKLRRLLEHKQ
jgi:RNA polymerase sigma-70 factor (ECF subfamily)